MIRIVSEGKSFLSFPDEIRITHRWQTIGLIVAPEENNTDVLNYFRIFISANMKDKVSKFVDYLTSKEEDEKAIQVIVRKLNEIPAEDQVNPNEQEKYTEAEIQAKFGEAVADPDFLVQTGDVSIGIDRIHLNTPMPCEVIYTIDPAFASLTASGKYSIQFSADNPYVSCEVQQGGVVMKLFELVYWQVWNERDTRKVFAGAPQTTPRIQKNSTGIWQAEFTGITPNSEFNFTYSRLLS